MRVFLVFELVSCAEDAVDRNNFSDSNARGWPANYHLQVNQAGSYTWRRRWHDHVHPECYQQNEVEVGSQLATNI
jgi:hypothetical protein